jgi:hypothetical protein
MRPIAQPALPGTLYSAARGAVARARGFSGGAMISGSCLCDSIRFRIRGELGPVGYCHCSMCRKANGSAFSTNGIVRRRDFSFMRGDELIQEYESSPGRFRAFCSRCGSPIYSRVDAQPEALRVRLGTLDCDPGRRPAGHVWVGSKAPWHTISDDLPQFEKGLGPPSAAH